MMHVDNHAKLDSDPDSTTPLLEPLGEQAFVLRGYALPDVTDLLCAIQDLQTRAPFRQMVTPGGLPMSVALTNCGALGWTTDRRGYRYSPIDPATGLGWPDIPKCFLRLAHGAAQAASTECATTA